MIYPEEAMARRLLKRHNLIPPYNLKRLVECYAEVNEIAFPPELDADGVSVGLGGENRPQILINKDRAETRKKFTLAHELGHVIIPWHTGTIVSENLYARPDLDQDYQVMEGEANRFAAELLIPANWIDETFRHSLSVSDAIKSLLATCGTSLEATLIKIFRETEEAIICLEYSLSGIFLKKHLSKRNRPPETPSLDVYSPDKENLFSLPCQYENFQLADKVFCCWRFLPSDFTENDPREWRLILNDIIADIPVAATEKNHLKLSLNATLAGQYQAHKHLVDPNEICSRIHRVLWGMEKFSALSDRSLIKDYIVKRVNELLEKDRQKAATVLIKSRK